MVLTCFLSYLPEDEVIFVGGGQLENAGIRQLIQRRVRRKAEYSIRELDKSGGRLAMVREDLLHIALVQHVLVDCLPILLLHDLCLN